jgi:hypothetical protein
MASYKIYDETANSTKTVSVDFLANILAASEGTFESALSYYFQIKTGARTTSGDSIPNTFLMALDELALNGVKQRRTDTAAAYTDINDMIEDYLYDYVNGHTENLHSSGVSARAAMQF